MESCCTTAVAVILLAAGSASANISYQNNFQNGAGPEWSTQLVETAPSGEERFLGQFGNESVTLSLPGVRAGSSVTLSFDFYAIRTWDGNEGGGGPGPDTFSVHVEGGPVLLDATFSVGDPDSQHTMSFPFVTNLIYSPSRAGAVANDTLGYLWNDHALDATWHMTYSFTAPTEGLVIRFSASGLQSIEDESWGIDNVTVNAAAVPAPATLGFAVAGIIGFSKRRRTRCA